MRAKLTTLNYCAVPFLSRVAANLYWYNYTIFSFNPLIYSSCSKGYDVSNIPFQHLPVKNDCKNIKIFKIYVKLNIVTAKSNARKYSPRI